MRRIVLAATAVSLALLLGGSTVGPASATYPGGNGRLYYGLLDGENVDVYSSRADGSGLRRLTHHPGFDACAAVSADGRRVAFCSERSGAFEIWTMRADGSGETQVTDAGGYLVFPDFNPAGTKIASSGSKSGAEESDVYVTNLATGRTRALTQQPPGGGVFNGDFPAYSPDGRRIAFVSERSGSAQIWVMNADGSHERQLTFDDTWKGQLPDWSPDGKWIAYGATDPDGVDDIWIMRADGSDQRRLTHGVGIVFGAAFSPNGERIAFVRANAEETVREVVSMRLNGRDRKVASPRGGFAFVPGWGPRVGEGSS